MQVGIGIDDVLAIGALIVFLSMVLLRQIDPRHRDGLPWTALAAIDDTLVGSAIIIPVALFLLWW
jgi:hypothetical protein